MDTAKQLAAKGQKIFRAGIWKPRTKPGGFEGIGVEGLAWLKEVKKETGMYVATEVATAKHVYECLKAGIDILWVGARTTANPFAVQEIADALKGVDIPVLVKNPVNPDLELWIGALERINNAGLKRLGAIHRGFSSYDKKLYRNLPQWHIPIELRRRIPNLPIICDPSHIGGKRELVAPLCQQAMDLGFNGLIIESHCNPDCAWSDAAQQVTPDVLDYILNRVDAFRDSELKELVLTRLEECGDRLNYYPAASKLHHAERSGLLHHTSTMLRMAGMVCEVYPTLNADLLAAGVILHDLCKLTEMDADEIGMVSDYTAEGMLIGHLVRGVSELDRCGRSLGVRRELLLLLEHMILSHHDLPEYGSPKKPMFPEAEVLHVLDLLDARMFEMNRELAGVQPGCFTDRIWSLDRKLYKTKDVPEKSGD